MSRKKKPQINNITIDAYAAEGKSIAHLEEGKVLFVENAIPGDVVNVRVTKNKKSWAEGKVLELVQPSPDRVDPFCPHFGTCGGCKWQMLPYSQQLKYKQQQVLDQLQRIGQIELPEMQPIMGSKEERYYRNKLEFTFCTHRYRTVEEIREAGDAVFPQEPVLGFHAPGLFDKVVEIHTCYLQKEPTNILLNVLRNYAEANKLPYYDYRSHSGWLRNVVIRVARTGEILINLVLGSEDKPKRKAILDHMLANIPGITTLHYTINPKVNDSIHDLEVHTYAGKGYIEETLEDFRFKISPKSFFQTNTYQAEELYKVTREFAGLTGTETLYDLYCGTGSIGIFCSKQAKKVIGIEVIEDAVKDAYKNAEMNGLLHCEFFAGDVSDICTDDFFATHGRPDVIITDPPRAGMHEKLVQQLLKMRAPKVVYVSCNPATQARDLKLLDEAYRVTRLQPVDMFPHTHHIENVALLELR
ncbi:23S rRNA (uracil(1939)-C(5))-methyltransferase RlmD [Polluticoccus soli]|uniref:23S rRNA (uracil(1939)-C(5))-methyltransferase RlmD n=1 Tax=Polluticoccus soli TaxID=3034150 RepID=UPI0023E0CBE1|nr:23S rRNA (uracil(1939)-C(5))-methyltransferase RlmD [Flavipsychrobacter sp. JY13-12]